MMLKDAEMAQIRELLVVADEDELLLAMAEENLDEDNDEDPDDRDTTDLFGVSTQNPSVARQVQALSTLWNGDISMTEEGLLDDPELDIALSTARFNRTLLKDDPQETAAPPSRSVDLKARLRANGDIRYQVVPPPAPYDESVVTPRWSTPLKDRLEGIANLVDLRGKDIFDETLVQVPHLDRGPRLTLVSGAEGWETPVDFSADDITF